MSSNPSNQTTTLSLANLTANKIEQRGSLFVGAIALHPTPTTGSNITSAYQLIAGSGAPSGTISGQLTSSRGRYIRVDASTVDTLEYVTVDSGTTWSAVDAGAVSSISDGTGTLALSAGALAITGVTAITTPANCTWNLGTGAITLGGTALATTGALAWTLLDASSTALVIGSAGDAAILTVDTTEGTERVTIGANYALKTDTIAETTGAAGVTIDGLLLKDGHVSSNDYVTATIAVADAGGGATTAALTTDCYRRDGTTALTAARQVMVTGQITTQYQPTGTLSTTLTFGTATKGSIIASGAGWCLAQTDTAGEFDCTATNSADEAVYFTVSLPARGFSDVSLAPASVVSNSDTATWSA